VAAILSFHSLEDRLAKQAFHQRSTWEPLWKKPRGASEEESSLNVRSRSAKLRAARLRPQESDEPEEAEPETAELEEEP
jgi:16S rRNA (cytosine1402-N4)-methyltransferase